MLQTLIDKHPYKHIYVLLISSFPACFSRNINNIDAGMTRSVFMFASLKDWTFSLSQSSLRSPTRGTKNKLCSFVFWSDWEWHDVKIWHFFCLLKILQFISVLWSRDFLHRFIPMHFPHLLSFRLWLAREWLTQPYYHPEFCFFFGASNPNWGRSRCVVRT